MLFDGEPGLASVKTQKEIFQKCNQLKVYANASFKRNMAERAVKELKIRLSIKLDLEGTALLFLLLLLLLLVPKITFFYVCAAGKPLSAWKTYLPTVVDSINFTRPSERNSLDILIQYFTSPTVTIPHMKKCFKFDINERVLIDLTPNLRRNLSYKYSLYFGKILKT